MKTRSPLDLCKADPATRRGAHIGREFALPREAGGKESHVMSAVRFLTEPIFQTTVPDETAPVCVPVFD